VGYHLDAAVLHAASQQVSGAMGRVPVSNG
jgi:hypothetical protein